VLSAELQVFADQRAALDAEAVGYRAAIAEAEHHLVGELAAVRAERATLVVGVPGGIVDQYEKLRTKLGGVGAARLVGPSCGGCHLSLPSGELERVRRQPPDAIVLCDHCGRILVR